MLGATACGSEGGTSASSARPSKSSSAQAPKREAPIETGIPPSPGARARAAYLAALQAIDPEIVHGKPDKAIDRGRNQCTSVKSRPGDRAYLLKTTNIRFTAPGHSQGFGAAKAQRILKAVRAYICPTY
ncbi:hypothetical protein E1298_12835 [Actinomadura rubrisoli]|uniref:DUF732 domain-containing protein n=2 Tax=Actinomadura rubrisoli TaxID=2530368 RepID=A0A4R5BX71_9ACTN|nr:hypothetical protein E1298_12835 [Actinomadura rubrisoli]